MAKVSLYREVKTEQGRRYVMVHLERRGRRSADFNAGPFCSRAGGRYEYAGREFKPAVEAMRQKQAVVEALSQDVAVKQDSDPNRIRVTEAVRRFIAKKSLLKDPMTVKAYTKRLEYFADWCNRVQIRNLDQITCADDLLPYVAFLRQRKTVKGTPLGDRTVHNAFRTLNTMLRSEKISFAGEILAQLQYEDKEVKPYKRHELDAQFGAADEDRFLHSFGSGLLLGAAHPVQHGKRFPKRM